MDNLDLIDILFFIGLLAGGALLMYGLWFFKNKHWAYLLFFIAYELTAYVFSDFFFQVEDYFNERLFIAFNLTGLIIILVLLARHLLKTKDAPDK